MQLTTVGLFAGLILGLAAALAGFSGLLITAFFGVVGYFLVKVIQGDIDVGEYLRSSRGSSGRRG
jgi:hypothetical protein